MIFKLEEGIRWNELTATDGATVQVAAAAATTTTTVVVVVGGGVCSTDALEFVEELLPAGFL